MKKSIDTTLPRTPKNAMADKPEPDEDDKMRNGEYDMDHLLKAEDIKNDPDRMKYVAKAHDKKTVAMRSIADLKIAGQALASQRIDELKAKAAQPRHKTRYPNRGN